MALEKLQFTFKPTGEYTSFAPEWSHTGVVGSGDMEVLLRHEDLAGAVQVKVVTPVRGYDNVWEKVLGKFVEDTRIGDAVIEINDNNSTPYIVSMRLKQALLEAKEGTGI